MEATETTYMGLTRREWGGTFPSLFRQLTPEQEAYLGATHQAKANGWVHYEMPSIVERQGEIIFRGTARECKRFIMAQGEIPTHLL